MKRIVKEMSALKYLNWFDDYRDYKRFSIAHENYEAESIDAWQIDLQNFNTNLIWNKERERIIFFT